MEAQSEAKLLRIFVGEADKAGHLPLYEVIVREARAAGLAGVRVGARVTDIQFGVGQHYPCDEVGGIALHCQAQL